ncbi:lipopolysaccharide-induced tumor necrosis factor-alpha factor homolog [Sitodiplosis mosellana]|uniref:lipopolysaccharide-induced tumor necrosis factor-alpha factor homolog n=1 Tax=Sitodiplosis mosellana TaxID=263140 RepID=UPI002444B387|nr:lipopolysaccharide-induced tumor necrosis factor-alpha factor homolog [Sitodiplosis mosellana]
MHHGTKVPEHPSEGYPHPHPPPQYTPNVPPQYTSNPIPLHPSVITQQPVQVVHIQTIPAVGPQPTMVVCMNCHKNVMTRLEYEASTRTHIIALTCCLFGLIPCAILPYFIDSCQNGNHYCPGCGAYIGTYTR